MKAKEKSFPGLQRKGNTNNKDNSTPEDDMDAIDAMEDVERDITVTTGDLRVCDTTSITRQVKSWLYSDLLEKNRENCSI